VLLWLRGGFHNHDFRPVAFRYAIGYIAAAAFWLLSVFVPIPFRFGLWIAGLTIDLFTPFWTFRYQEKLPSLSSSHLPERFGLFTIIVLGEAVAGVIRGLAAIPDFNLKIASIGALGMSLAFGIWWIYFDFIARRLAKPHIEWRSKLAYLHLPLLLSIAAVGAGVQSVVTSEANGLTIEECWLISIAVGLSMISIGLIEMTLPSEREEDEPFEHAPSAPLKICLGLIAPLVVALNSWLDPRILLAALLLITLIPVFYGVFRWGQSEKPLPTGKDDDERVANDTEGIQPAQE
jgi:low temperature requirement protein LtrA